MKQPSEADAFCCGWHRRGVHPVPHPREINGGNSSWWDPETCVLPTPYDVTGRFVLLET